MWTSLLGGLEELLGVSMTNDGAAVTHPFFTAGAGRLHQPRACVSSALLVLLPAAAHMGAAAGSSGGPLGGPGGCEEEGDGMQV